VFSIFQVNLEKGSKLDENEILEEEVTILLKKLKMKL